MVAEANQLNEHLIRHTHDIIIVGTGPAGIRLVKELKNLNSNATIAIFGDEPWKPYNRVKLSSLLTGDIKEESLYSNYDLTEFDNVTTFYNNRITEIDRYSKHVVDSQGHRHHYQHLILATGSTPRKPAIPGIDYKNIFTFRDLNDAQQLMSRSVRTRKTIVIGGGLLGLEAARAMQRFNTEVHVVEHSMWLMFNQIDERAGRYLQYYVESLGIHIHLCEHVKQIHGDENNKATGVELSNGDVIECDTIIIAAGIAPNTQLARQAKLPTAKGIRVNDQLQTGDRHIYAIGECAEHNDKVYGLVAPGLEQAAVVAHHLNNRKTRYTGSIAATNLKVLDYSVFSAGNTGNNVREREMIVYQDHKNEIYRKLVVINGRIRGAVGIGHWPGVNRIQEAVEKKRRIWAWQITRFKEQGLIWNDAQSENVIDWPATATVCNCTGVTRGQLDNAMKRGAKTFIEISQATGASTVCGSCKNLVEDFIGGNSQPEPASGYKPMLIASVLALLATLIALFAPAIPYTDHISDGMGIDVLWQNSLYKQISGFSLLGVSLVISIISFRKRLRKIITFWEYPIWRMIHVLTGFLLVGVLLLHTGFNLGSNLNFYLMLCYLGLLLAGSIAGGVIAYEHKIPRSLARPLRSYAIWSHILLLWPLPALLGFHIFKTYYF